MNDLFKKLNTLVRASINDFVDEAASTVRKPGERLGKNIDDEVKALRLKINDALAYEDELKARLDTIRKEVDDLDQQADEAVDAGRDDDARYLIARHKRAEQRMAMTEADLEDHRAVTRELIMRVNELDATIADARRAEQQQAEAEAAEAAQADTPPSDEKPKRTPEGDEVIASIDPAATLQQAGEKASRALADALRDARERISQMGDTIAAQDAVQQPTAAEQAAEEVSKDAVEDDLSARRSRLSGPSKKPKTD